MIGALCALVACDSGGGGGGGGGGDGGETAPGTNLTGIFTQRYDTQRSGLNLRETALTPSSVTPARFGKLFACPIDGEAYAEPLVVANLVIAGGVHTVVFVATAHDSVYAFDAAANFCVPYWQTSFLGTGITPVPPSDTGESGDINKEIGIIGTPVIDPGSRTLFVAAKTRETVGVGCSGASPCYRQRLHALDLATGDEKFNGPAEISNAITVAGNGDTGDATCPAAPTRVPFCPLHENQRGSLLLLNGRVYLSWSAHGANFPYHGWLMGFSASDLRQAPTVFNDTRNGAQGGIWMSGTGPAVDDGGNIYLMTGNGIFDTAPPRANYAMSFLKLSTPGLAVLDFFTPSNQADLNAADLDLGSGGALVLPDAAGSADHPHLAIGGGKEGVLFLVDRDNLGGFSAAVNHVVQAVTVSSGSPCMICGIFSTPVYWAGHLYVVPVGDVVKQYSLANAALSATPTRSGSEVFGFPGASPVISANGSTGAILWLLDTSDNGTPNGSGSNGPAILYAYDPLTLSVLFSSPTGGAGAAGDAVKFTVPTVTFGRVYVGTQTELSVFGLR
ncbi:MAG TPA: pyrrolo-quinoline quinone [Myxococcota bacterium]|nr:pyrrolo-quinoline quinone [Myxococcota bacterium]